MGFDPELIALMKQELDNLKLRVVQLELNNSPRQDIVNVGVASESNVSNVIGSAIQNAYERINEELVTLREEAVTPQVNVRINQLIALKAQVPYHFSISQGDQEWLNNEINAILGTNSSS